MHLLRSFSKNPKDLIAIFQEYFFARIPILAIVIITLIFLYEPKELGYLILWVLCLFIYNSFIPVIFYFRDFGKQIFIELISFIFLIILVNYYKNILGIFNLIKCYSFYLLFKLILISIVYYRFLLFKSTQINFKLLIIGYPFLLLAISGFLQSKIDLYTFSYYNNDIALGEYQIISGFFIFSQSIATIIVLPYIKNIYRMPMQSILKFRHKISILGLLINSMTLIFIYNVLIVFFEIYLNLIQLSLGFIISYLCYIYTIDIFILFKRKKEKKVVLISILCMLINFLTSILLLNYSSSITSALLANAIAQVFSLVYYLKLREHKSISI